MRTKQVKEYGNDFKLKVVLEAVQNKETINQIAQKYKILPHNIKYWKKQFYENAGMIFNKNQGLQGLKEEVKAKDASIDELHRQIGQISAELERAKKNLGNWELTKKKELIDKGSKLSIVKQCKIIGLTRSSYYYAPLEMDIKDLEIINEMDMIYTDYPFYGYKKVREELITRGYNIGKDRVHKYKNILGLITYYPKKKTSIPNINHKIYPYLLIGVDIVRPNQVWAIDITYIRLRGGYCYLVAIIDWYSRKILSHRISNSMDMRFSIDTLEEALNKYGNPEIFNSDQGSQFTSLNFVNILLERNIKVSMDSKGRAKDNIAIERFWRSIKYENIYLTEYQNIYELEKGIEKYIRFYNEKRYHQTFNYKTPDYIYNNTKEELITNNFNEGQIILENIV